MKTIGKWNPIKKLTRKEVLKRNALRRRTGLLPLTKKQQEKENDEIYGKGGWYEKKPL